MPLYRPKGKRLESVQVKLDPHTDTMASRNDESTSVFGIEAIGSKVEIAGVKLDLEAALRKIRRHLQQQGYNVRRWPFARDKRYSRLVDHPGGSVRPEISEEAFRRLLLSMC